MALPIWPAVVGGWATRVGEHAGGEVADPWLWPIVVIWQFSTLVPGGTKVLGHLGRQVERHASGWGPPARWSGGLASGGAHAPRPELNGTHAVAVEHLHYETGRGVDVGVTDTDAEVIVRNVKGPLVAAAGWTGHRSRS